MKPAVNPLCQIVKAKPGEGVNGEFHAEPLVFASIPDCLSKRSLHDQCAYFLPTRACVIILASPDLLKPKLFV